MTELERLAARLFVVGIRGPELDPDERELFDAHAPGGVIVFRRNLSDEPALRALLSGTRTLLGPEAFLAIDQEGGTVDRMKSLDGPRPSFDTVTAGGAGDPAATRTEAEAVCGRLRDLGFDTNYAPVVDRGPVAEGTGLEHRCAGGDPSCVIRHARAWLHGSRAAGVYGSLKHYPGLGGSRVDSHHALPKVHRDATAQAADLAPYEALSAEAPLVMIAHCLYPEETGSELPASLHPEWYRRLRQDQRFEGIAIADDLEMGALASFGGLPERAAAALSAGADQAFLCSRREELPECARLVARELGADGVRTRLARIGETRRKWLRNGHMLP